VEGGVDQEDCLGKEEYLWQSRRTVFSSTCNSAATSFVVKTFIVHLSFRVRAEAQTRVDGERRVSSRRETRPRIEKYE
jgi:hypothetical protein